MRVATLFLSLCCGLVYLLSPVTSAKCSPRKFDQDSVVCVCNQTFCDTVDEVQPVAWGSAIVYESSQAGKRLDNTTLKFGAKRNRFNAERNLSEPIVLPFHVPTVTISVNGSVQYQEIIGFGGAFTDAAGINIQSLPTNMQEAIIQAYYSKQGLEYNIGRIPMASCDFSTRPYSYDDVENDFQLEHFKLADEDFKFKIPYIQMAKTVAKEPIFFFASPWSSPYWMKTNNKMNGKGSLKGDVGGQYYETWANYFVKFLQSYNAQNVSIWGLTAENEPSNGFIENFSFQCLGFTAEYQRDFIVKNLGPALEKAGYGPDKVKLMILDDQRLFMPKFPDTVLADPIANKYVSGIAFHWYTNELVPAKVMDIVHQHHPDKFLFASEACSAARPWELPKVALGNWARGEDYAHDIIEDINHWSTSWVDWNLVLDLKGGPNWVKNFVDAAVIVDPVKKEFYKQPMFYALGHFSKFVPRKSVRIDHRVQLEDLFDGPKVETVAFKRPDGAYVVVVMNRNIYSVPLNIKDPVLGTLANDIPARGIQTYIWWRKHQR